MAVNYLRQQQGENLPLYFLAQLINIQFQVVDGIQVIWDLDGQLYLFHARRPF